MKDLLLRLVGEMEELAANQLVLGNRVGAGLSKDAADIAKKLAMRENKEHFDGLRAEIEAL